MVRLDKWGMLRGDVVYCNLMGGWEHSGIYVGQGKIVHLVNEINQYGKMGRIIKSGVDEFLTRCNGWNPAWTVYVACELNGDHIGLPFYAMQAEAIKKARRGYGYDLLFRNCHQFTSKCLGCEQHIIFPFWNLERHLKEDYSFDHWEECLT